MSKRGQRTLNIDFHSAAGGGSTANSCGNVRFQSESHRNSPGQSKGKGHYPGQRRANRCTHRGKRRRSLLFSSYRNGRSNRSQQYPDPGS
ncbi:MAG: hypothetical protein V2J65_03945 [Desulfobacteraceae bacterium]|nr:hypothetical protein [Desulfobacteraceae bacterium]